MFFCFFIAEMSSDSLNVVNFFFSVKASPFPYLTLSYPILSIALYSIFFCSSHRNSNLIRKYLSPLFSHYPLSPLPRLSSSPPPYLDALSPFPPLFSPFLSLPSLLSRLYPLHPPLLSSSSPPPTYFNSLPPFLTLLSLFLTPLEQLHCNCTEMRRNPLFNISELQRR